MFKSFSPDELPVAQLHQYMLGSIAPRPIAWASTVDEDGRPNLAPFSFFNFFSSNPPVLIFSPSRRVKDNTTKHTLANVLATKEVVINIVNYDLMGQMVLTSAEYGEEDNEFEFAGLDTLPSVKVKPMRVAASPAQFECVVKDVIKLGEGGGAGNLVICEVVHMHINENVFNEEGKVDPFKMDNVARLGYIWYTRAREGLFELPTPRVKAGKGILDLPHYVRNSRYFTETEMAKLASLQVAPEPGELDMVRNSTGMHEIEAEYPGELELASKVLTLAKNLLAENKIVEAWRVMLAYEKILQDTHPLS
jgi:flavin reductase (DIM6/NTAB) family NADH-FMN oxidoreductase RutF